MSIIDVQPLSESRYGSKRPRFRVAKRPIHLNRGWMFLVFDDHEVGFCENVPGISNDGYPSKELAEKAIKRRPASDHLRKT